MLTTPLRAPGPGLMRALLPYEAPPLDAYLYWDTGADRDPANIWVRALITDAAQAPPDE
jgi:hypothetical protein